MANTGYFIMHVVRYPVPPSYPFVEASGTKVHCADSGEGARGPGCQRAAHCMNAGDAKPYTTNWDFSFAEIVLRRVVHNCIRMNPCRCRRKSR
jgi:hypothetical protein